MKVTRASRLCPTPQARSLVRRNWIYSASHHAVSDEFRSANGAPHTSLGQRPRNQKKEIQGLKARCIGLRASEECAGLSALDVCLPVTWGVAPGYNATGPLALIATAWRNIRTYLCCASAERLATRIIAALLAWPALVHAQVAMPQQQAPFAAPLAAGSPTPEIRPIAPPVPVFPYPMWMVVTAAVIALLILSAITWAVVRYIKNRPQPPPPTPREIALAALSRLRERVHELAPYPFSIEVSDVLRMFVTQEFRLSATRQTSPEFLAAASASPRFSEADKALLAAFLEKSDLIKFARMNASLSDSEQLLEQAVRFVEGGVPA